MTAERDEFDAEESGVKVEQGIPPADDPSWDVKDELPQDADEDDEE